MIVLIFLLDTTPLYNLNFNKSVFSVGSNEISNNSSLSIDQLSFLSFSSPSSIFRVKFNYFLTNKTHTWTQASTWSSPPVKIDQLDVASDKVHPMFHQKYFELLVVKPDQKQHDNDWKCLAVSSTAYILRKGR